MRLPGPGPCDLAQPSRAGLPGPGRDAFPPPRRGGLPGPPVRSPRPVPDASPAPSRPVPDPLRRDTPQECPAHANHLRRECAMMEAGLGPRAPSGVTRDTKAMRNT
ncbi:hypothetical protein GCM10010505_22950 [Kitasatospora aburaviensis]